MFARGFERIIVIGALVMITAGTVPTTSSGSGTESDAALQTEIDAQARLQAELRAAEKAAKDLEREREETALREREEAQAKRESKVRAGYESKISGEMSIQDDLLWQATGRGDAPEQVLIPIEGQDSNVLGDPRVAPRTPVDRDLPREIFDEEEITVPSGTWGNHPDLVAIKLELDADGDGRPELVRWIDQANGRTRRQAADRNYDGNTDTWSNYIDGILVSRTLDSNDDGTPDTWERFSHGFASNRERDRDDDGVRDVFYRYEGKRLVEERHDANNDGRIDLVIHYMDGHRERSEEDLDGDGRIDKWATFIVDPSTGRERVGRIDLDRTGRGQPDTFETFGHQAGKSVLERREEDKNGDGRIDVVSFFVNGKLRMRQIAEPTP